MNRKISILILLSIIISTSYFGQINYPEQIHSKTIEDIKVLTLIADGYGEVYYEAKNIFETMGFNYTTVGLDDNCSICYNLPPDFVIPDLIVSDVTDEILSEFDCILIPPGPHHLVLGSNESALNLIRRAYDAGLTIASICIGNYVVAMVPNLVDGVKVADNMHSNTEMEYAGATPVTDSYVVIDQRIITSDWSWSNPEKAPTYEVGVAIAMIALGQSYITSSTIKAIDTDEGTVYNVSVVVNEIANIYENWSTIMRISAYAYLPDSNNLTERVDLTHIKDNIYSGNFTTLKNKGGYSIELEVKNLDGVVEIIRDIEDASIFAPGFQFSLVIIIMTSLVFIYNKFKIRSKK